MQMDGTYNLYEYYVDNAEISFKNTCNTFYNPTYKVDRMLVRNLDIKADLVVGLNFIFQDNGGCILTRDGVVFFKQTTYTPVQTSNKATRGRYRIDEGNNTNQACCKTCKDKSKCSEKTYQEDKIEEESYKDCDGRGATESRQ